MAPTWVRWTPHERHDVGGAHMDRVLGHSGEEHLQVERDRSVEFGAAGPARLGVAILLWGAGLGLSSAPATESIMGAPPSSRAGVGSYVNDTAREVDRCGSPQPVGNGSTVRAAGR
jgi:hypothetical protein